MVGGYVSGMEEMRINLTFCMWTWKTWAQSEYNFESGLKIVYRGCVLCIPVAQDGMASTVIFILRVPQSTTKFLGLLHICKIQRYDLWS
jgi:hypothetical protein